jgi:hypothetical protein
MRARAAYISSLGTTGILVAAALLMLALVSALVAFRGWPGGMADSIASVPVARAAETPVALTQVRAAKTPRVTVHAVRAAHTTRPAVRVSTAGLVKTTHVETAPTDVVKVPPGVHMTLPPLATPTARPPEPARSPVQTPTVEPSRPPSFLPQPPTPGEGPVGQAVGQAIGDVVGPLPGDTAPGTTGPVFVDPATTTIDVTIGDTAVSVSLGPRH